MSELSSDTLFETNMNKEQVIAKIGKERWKDFLKFMAGQTVGFDKGIVDYYECDVNKFASRGKDE